MRLVFVATQLPLKLIDNEQKFDNINLKVFERNVFISSKSFQMHLKQMQKLICWFFNFFAKKLD